MAGLLLAPVSMADHVPLLETTVASELHDFEAGPGGWTEFHPSATRPDPANPSWAWGTVSSQRSSANPSWQWGAPTSGPGAAASGSNVWATNLAGAYNASECSGILSPPIDLTSATSASVSFMQWRHIEDSSNAGTGTAWDAGLLFVTEDSLVTLTKIASPTPAYNSSAISTTPRACLDAQPTGTKGFSGPAGSTNPVQPYTSISADLTPFAGKVVQFLIAFGSDGVIQRAGWYIDDFTVTVDGVSSTEDFEAGDGGFAVVGTMPPIGPPAAHSGSKAWATNPTGAYNNNECSAIMSPPIDLTGAASASVSFMEWRHFFRSSATATKLDAGTLFATSNGGVTFTRIATPTPDYGTGTIGTSAASCFDGQATSVTAYGGPVDPQPGPAFSAVGADLTPFVGGSVRFVIAFGSDGSTTRGGWYVDDFAVTIDGTTTVEDFEAGDGGFTVISTKAPGFNALGWEHGTPPAGVGPGPVSAMWGTNIDGNHGTGECSYIESPQVDLTALGANRATLSWRQWFRGGSSSGGVVQVYNGSAWENVKPTTGYPSNPTSSLNACLQDDAQGSGGFAGNNTPTDAMIDYEADLTKFIGQSVQVRFLFATTNTSTTLAGWYVDDVAIEQANYVGTPHLPSGPNICQPILLDPLGWCQGGVGTWAYGNASVGPGSGAGPVWATNLTGNYHNSECGFIESPPVLGLALAADPNLTFEQWFRIESIFSTTAFDLGWLMVSGDGGSTWAYLNTSVYNRTAGTNTALQSCLASHGAPSNAMGFSGNRSYWDPITVDLSAYASSPLVKVRFVFGSDTSVSYEGWHIRNVKLGGQQVLP